MYNELHEVWKQEHESVALVKLRRDFYSELADYLRRLREESRMLDKRTVKARLLEEETQNARRMIMELIRTRYRKLVRQATEGEKMSSDALTIEEEKIYSSIRPSSEAVKLLVNDILRGCMPKVDVGQERERAVLRFFKDIPAIIGADMKTYGPFKAEDVASLHLENARILAKQGLAAMVDFI